MNFYQQEIIRIRDAFYPHAYQLSRIIAAKHFIEQHAYANIGLKEMARSACLSKFHFIRLFKKCYGRTPHQLLTEIRMVKAKQMLQTGYSVSDTCFQLGFVSTTSFTGLFKKHTGYAPRHYQQKKQF